MANPINVINKACNETFKSAVLNNIVWMADTICINRARSLVRSAFSESDATNPFDDWLIEVQNNNEWANLNGFNSSYDELLNIMAFAQDAADALRAADTNGYRKRKSFEELLVSEKPMVLTSDERKKIELMVRECDPDEDSIDEQVELMLEKRQEDINRINESNELMKPLVLRILQDVELMNIDSVTNPWNSMDDDVKEMLVNHTVRAINDTKTRATQWKKTPVEEYMVILKDAKALKEELAG